MNLNESSESFQSFSSALDSFEIASVETCLKNNTIFDSKLHKEYLRFHLTEKLITNEFQFTFIDTAASLTTVKIGNNLNKIYLKTDTTMRFVNPIPFVEKCLSFFLWGPLGVNSLLQRFGAMVTDHDKTIAKLAIEREKLGSLAIPIEEYINKSFSNRCSLNEESTNQDLLAFFSDSNIPHLIESYNARNSTHRKFKIENCFSLVKLHLRVKEKEKFISALGSPNIIKLITLISKIFPPLLSEIYSVSNFHDVFQQFFKTLSEILEILEFDYSKKKSDWKTTIEKIKCPIRMFFNIFYDIIYKISHKNPTGENGFHSLVEWFIKLMLNFSQLHSSATFSTCVPNIENQTTSNCVLEKIFSSLSNEEKKNLEQELNYLILKKEYVGNMKDHENNDLNFIEGKFLDLWFENVINKSS
ncbi:hypothetical protein HK099_004919 [Clydaea vesicula]|uniref:PX domain-containing protein n=1 Tax=Clydaea vesicula TaxID=447962 RepID=A0AAD5TZZ3_9FUNG|nr:hypothetical protein HK099_004919 [Clydaea vesicula]